MVRSSYQLREVSHGPRRGVAHHRRAAQRAGRPDGDLHRRRLGDALAVRRLAGARRGRAPDPRPDGPRAGAASRRPGARQLRPDDPRHRDPAGPAAGRGLRRPAPRDGRLPPQGAVRQRPRAADRPARPRPGHGGAARTTASMPAEAAATAAQRAWSMGFPFHAAKRLRGYRLVATDHPWTAGEGSRRGRSGPAAAVTGRRVLPGSADRRATLRWPAVS